MGSALLILTDRHAFGGYLAPVSPGPPEAPRNAVLVAVTTTTVEVGWQSAGAPETDPVQGYRVFQTSPAAVDPVAETSASARDAVISGLTPSTPYTFEVEAFNAFGTGPRSIPVQATTTAVTPPTGMAATRAETFARSFGVNTHGNFSYAPHNQHADVNTWLEDLGVRIIRDRFTTQPDQITFQKTFYDAGGQIHSTVDDPAVTLPQIKSTYPAGGAYPAAKVFRSIGNENEPNNTSASRGRRPWNWAVLYRNIQKLLFNTVNGDGALTAIPVCSGALKDNVPDLLGDSTTGNWVQDVGGTAWAWEGTGPTSTVGSQAAMLALPDGTGRIAIRTDQSDVHGKGNCHFKLTSPDASVLANWKKLEFHPGLLSADLAADPVGQYVEVPDYHKYPGGGNSPSAGMAQRQGFARDSYDGAGKPFYCTEAGFHTALRNTSGGQGVPYDVHGKYMLVLWAEHYRYGLDSQGVGNIFFQYEFLGGQPTDDTVVTSTHEDSFGLVETDVVDDETTWVAKPAFTALKNLLEIVGDRDAGPGAEGARLSFTPTPLPLTVSGGGATRDQFLLQKADGTHWLVLWREEKLYKPAATPARQTISTISTTVTATSSKTWQVFTPYTSTTGAAPTSATSKVISLGEDLVVVKIT